MLSREDPASRLVIPTLRMTGSRLAAVRFPRCPDVSVLVPDGCALECSSL